MFRRIALTVALTILLTCFALPVNGDFWGPECTFWEGPDIRPTARGANDSISECPCYLTGIVKNTGSNEATYVHVIATVLDEETGELVNAAWAQVAGGKLQPGQEEFVRFSLGSQNRGPAYERRLFLRWKGEEYTRGDVECVIESAYTTYRQDSSAFICGFIRSIDCETGFAPKLQARVLDVNGKTANIVTASMPRLPVGPGETIPFLLTIPALSPTDTIDLFFENV